jgi:Holliday junction DNA helicase RuvA
MIGRLRGVLASKSPQFLLVDVAGVGYRVVVPLTTFYRVGEEGSTITLQIHTHVRDDALQLFGFLTSSEQSLFERLIAVSGVGPRLAVGILSGIETADLIEALRAGDVGRLTRIPGIGKKTAERLVLELRETMQRMVTPGGPLSGPPDSRQEDLLAALIHLGYSRAEAERAAQHATREHASAPLEDLLRLSLRALSSR